MKIMKPIPLTLAAVLALGTLSVRAADVPVTANITQDTTWTADNEYLLGQPIFVTDGATLTIEPGTTVYGFEDVGNGTFGSLIITRGSKIMAEGTKENPIDFTALDERDGGLTLEDSSLWGGLIILGNAVLNDADNPVLNPDNPVLNEREIEGFPAGGNNDLIRYGGLDDADNSGVLRYVSIRYGGFEFETDEEINGLTLGAVGSGTTIEYVEVFNNSDDGVEFFGGTVNTKYLVMAFNEDEQFDIDQGYRGKNQFWFGIGKSVGAGSNYGGEHDGGDSPDKTLEPFSRTNVYNATFLGSGVKGGNPQTNTAFRLKDNFAGQYHNSIFGDFPGQAVRIDDDSTKERANTEGDLAFRNNLWFDIGSYDGTAASLTLNGSAEEIKVVSENGNDYANPYLAGVSRQAGGGLDPRPHPAGPAYSNSRSDIPADDFYTAVNYVGAFSAEDNWMEGWTYLSRGGYLPEAAPAELTDVTVTENITADTVWTNDNAYLLGQPIFVTEGATLTIEAGTTIYGFEDLDAGTFGSLIVTRGSKLYAEGTRDLPIVFTALDVRDGALTLEDSSLWGGVILLGNAVLNDAGNPVIQADNPILNEREIEGFPAGGNNDFIKYGGLDDEDNSGSLRFVSIRYGGFEFETDEEINGLTLGAVGSGTTIEFVEVFNNSDDGVEFFGGTVDVRYMVMAFNEDEQYDIDQGYRGRGQFLFAIGKNVGAGSNYGGEHDGGDSPDKTLEPFARNKFYNVTYIGSGAGDDGNPQTNAAFRLKDNYAGQYHNSIITDFKDYAIRIDDDATKERVNTEGDLFFGNNTWFGFGAVEEGNFTSYTLNGSAEELLVLSQARGNTFEDPQLRGISRAADGGLDPRPLASSPVFGATLSDFPDDQSGFFTPADFRGAFGALNWAEGWTALSEQGFVAEGGAVTDVAVTENITEDTTWTANNAYLLGQPIFVTNGATLTIEPGTTVYGFEDIEGGTFGSLIITRGAKIMAEGSKTDPIVFTALDERDGELTLEDSSLWGGLIILGQAILNDADNPNINPDNPVLNEREIEGFPAGGNNDFIKYGGLDDDDNSGVLKYVSIRYGGFEFETDEEINGLTLGAVGRGTTIEYVEVFNNSDDGVEFFGGTVNTKYLVMAFNEDEQFDIDQGYRGMNQFWFGIGKSVGAGSNYGGEHDGGDSPDKTLEPFARSQVYNATYLGSGVKGGNPQTNTAFRLKDNFAGQYHNSIFGDFPNQAVRIDDDSTKERANTEGDLSFENNLWFDFGSYDGTAESLTLNGSAEEIAVVSSNGNNYANPYLGGISRRPHGGLDPRPVAGGPAYSNGRSGVPDNGFYDQVNYVGAFSANDNWMEGWTYLSQKGYLSKPAPTTTTDVAVTENVTEDTTWTNDKTYLLGAPIFVTNNATLTIEAGTEVLGFEDLDAGTFGSLVVTRGAKIYAEGTRSNPIVFSALDARAGGLTLEDSSLWGGLIVLGNAVLNDAGNPIIQPDNPVLNEREIEGFPAGGNNDFIKYGGLNDEDDSGVLRYVSIQYGGFEFETDEEINGLTLGAVGSGTTVEFVEVFNNSDDGVEFFGGTVDVRYMVMAFNEDEQYDIDQGYRGRGQFLFAIGKNVGAGSNYGGEHDGGDSPDKTLEPYARNQFYNVTYIGSGAGDDGNPQTNAAFRLKDNYAGQYHNSIITDFKDYAVRIDDDPTKARVNEGDLAFMNNIWHGFGSGDGSDLAALTLNGSAEELLILAGDRGNQVTDPFLRGISRTADGGLDPRPSPGSPAIGGSLSGFPEGQSGFFTTVNHKGAFRDVNWMNGWTQISRDGYIGNLPGVGGINDVTVAENITEDTTWTSDKNYLLGQPIFVTNGATLTIEPGTTVYGFEDTALGTFGSLIITRGSKIMAEGTKDAPIVFTALDARDGELTLEDSSLWGGLIILGNAILNDADNPIINPDNPVLNEREIEGFPAGGNNEFIKYGGLDDDDNSGVLRYVSIQYGGFEFETDEEINGLTLGAVGRGTTIEYVEVFNNSDDGVEFFGGTVDVKYLVMAFNEDEQYDIDQGYRGRGQFLFAIGKNVGAGSNYGGEHDGGDSPDKTLEPYARSQFYNVTYIGSGAGDGGNPQTNAAFRLKDNFAGQYHNSIITDFKDYAVRIDDDPTKARVNDGDLFFGNNTWFGFGSGDGSDLGALTLNASAEELLVLAADRGNAVEDPQLRGISRTTDGGLDPRPLNASPVMGAALSNLPEGDFFETVSYRGAFGAENWMDGWTKLSQDGYLGDLDGGPAAGPQDVTQPGDAIVLVNGVNDDDADAGAPPGAEGVENAINNVTQKYLNFLDLGSGLIVTPGVGATTVGGLNLYTANDAVERDPASYKLEGSVAGADGPWSLISEGPLALPDERNDGGDIPITADLNRQVLAFDNEWAYLSYRLTFPTLKDAANANSMQIAEIELTGAAGGTLDPNPPVDPELDSDGDGTPDAVEIANGTDPNNPASFFTLASVAAGELSWASGEGATYDIEYSEDLVTWNVVGTVQGTAGQSSFSETDAGRLGKASGYYRVVLK